MKRYKLLFLAFLLIFAFAACTGNGNEPEASPAPVTESVDTTVAEETVEPDAVPEQTFEEVETPEVETPEIVFAGFPAGVVYSIAYDPNLQAQDVGVFGEVKSIFGDPHVYIEQAGNPRCTVIEGTGDTNAFTITQRQNSWDSIDLVTSAFDWDLNNNEYLLTVRGYAINSGTMKIGGADNPWTSFTEVELNSGEEFTLTLVINSDVIAESGSRGNIRIQMAEEDVDYGITELSVVLYIPRADNIVYSMSTDPYIQALAVGTSGDDVVLATPNLSSAGGPDYIVIETPYGNGINVRNRDSDYFSIDFISDAIDWDFDNNNYTLTVIGNVGQGEEFVIGGADNPWDRFAQEEADGDKNFTAVISIASEEDLNAAGSRRWFRLMENGIEHYEIHDIILEKN